MKRNNQKSASNLHPNYNIPFIKSQGVLLSVKSDNEKNTKEAVLQKLAIYKNNQQKVIDILMAIPNESERAFSLAECGTYIEIQTCKCCGAHITASNFCRERVCPVCAWRRQSKYRAEFSKMADFLQLEPKNLRHLTLTIKNVEAEALSETLNQMFQAWNLLNKYAEWKKAVQGYSRCLEITYNSETRTYHPHFHCLIHKKGNVSLKVISSLWKKALKVQYIPETHITQITDEKGILECFKYSFKSADSSPELIKAFLYTIKGRRLVGFGGTFKKARAILNQDDNTLTDSGCIYGRSTNPDVLTEVYRFDYTGGIYRAFKTF